ncbi:hypothetical protein B0H15DRAFT_807001 [Mycena belliarum]|uniref:Uncharacterized protein n=1 Tax=Mycena belliarum TaxID=1033014 RepID=A0AAD6TSE1_9AGAR|nr:hypothetical protein B0H15DRAFT_807001 [Mycena belliae]
MARNVTGECEWHRAAKEAMRVSVRPDAICAKSHEARRSWKAMSAERESDTEKRDAERPTQQRKGRGGSSRALEQRLQRSQGRRHCERCIATAHQRGADAAAKWKLELWTQRAQHFRSIVARWRSRDEALRVDAERAGWIGEPRDGARETTSKAEREAFNPILRSAELQSHGSSDSACIAVSCGESERQGATVGEGEDALAGGREDDAFDEGGTEERRREASQRRDMGRQKLKLQGSELDVEGVASRRVTTACRDEAPPGRRIEFRAMSMPRSSRELWTLPARGRKLEQQGRQAQRQCAPHRRPRASAAPRRNRHTREQLRKRKLELRKQQAQRHCSIVFARHRVPSSGVLDVHGRWRCGRGDAAGGRAARRQRAPQMSELVVEGDPSRCHDGVSLGTLDVEDGADGGSRRSAASSTLMESGMETSLRHRWKRRLIGAMAPESLERVLQFARLLPCLQACGNSGWTANSTRYGLLHAKEIRRGGEAGTRQNWHTHGAASHRAEFTTSMADGDAGAEISGAYCAGRREGQLGAAGDEAGTRRVWQRVEVFATSRWHDRQRRSDRAPDDADAATGDPSGGDGQGGRRRADGGNEAPPGCRIEFRAMSTPRSSRGHWPLPARRRTLEQQGLSSASGNEGACVQYVAACTESPPVRTFWEHLKDMEQGKIETLYRARIASRGRGRGHADGSLRARSIGARVSGDSGLCQVGSFFAGRGLCMRTNGSLSSKGCELNVSAQEHVFRMSDVPSVMTTAAKALGTTGEPDVLRPFKGYGGLTSSGGGVRGAAARTQCGAAEATEERRRRRDGVEPASRLDGEQSAQTETRAARAASST